MGNTAIQILQGIGQVRDALESGRDREKVEARQFDPPPPARTPFPWGAEQRAAAEQPAPQQPAPQQAAPTAQQPPQRPAREEDDAERILRGIESLFK